MPVVGVRAPVVDINLRQATQQQIELLMSNKGRSGGTIS